MFQILTGEISSNTAYKGTATVTYKDCWTWADFMASNYNDGVDLTPENEASDSSVICGFVMRNIPDQYAGAYTLLCGVKPDGTKVLIPQNEVIGSNDYVRLTAKQ